MDRKIYDKQGNWIATETTNSFGSRVIEDRDGKILNYLDKDFLGNDVVRDADQKVQYYKGQDALGNQILSDRDGKKSAYLQRDLGGNAVFRDLDGKTTGYYDLDGGGKGGFFSPDKPKKQSPAPDPFGLDQFFQTLDECAAAGRIAALAAQPNTQSMPTSTPTPTPASVHKPSVGTFRNKMSHSTFQMNASKLKGLPIVDLRGEELLSYAFFAAALLRKLEIPFDLTAEIKETRTEQEKYGLFGHKTRRVTKTTVLETHRCWLMEQLDESDEDSRGNEREDTVYYVLTEKGTFLKGRQRDIFYANGRCESLETKWEPSPYGITSRHIDLYFKKKNIEMHSGLYKAMVEQKRQKSISAQKPKQSSLKSEKKPAQSSLQSERKPAQSSLQSKKKPTQSSLQEPGRKQGSLSPISEMKREELVTEIYRHQFTEIWDCGRRLNIKLENICDIEDSFDRKTLERMVKDLRG